MKEISMLHEINILGYLRSLPADIERNISMCIEKWKNGETTDGYPHPVQVCSNLQAANNRMPFLSIQELVNLQLLKIQLTAAL
ncbi:hypothetical protein [Paenibacillus tepidiphilus]|uniref:hypothetical protein n=1 Tax=Paenibacillus tepidiphilus TaxID=2608683 RepID=UPI001238704D|nr:hypothetical protein [Paenibacillus tepidiphilus]